MNRDPIRAKVARILNTREIAITAGSNLGIKKDMIFDVIDPKGENIRDPDTNEVLDSLSRCKVRVKIVEVKEKISVASTYRLETVNIGGSGGGLLGGLDLLIPPPKYVEVYETFKTSEQAGKEYLDESESFVKIGDPVIEVINPEENNEVSS